MLNATRGRRLSENVERGFAPAQVAPAVSMQKLRAQAAQAGIKARLGFLRHYVKSTGSVDIFENMSDSSRMTCFEHMVLRTYQAGERIVVKGAVGSVLYFVEKGEAAAQEGSRILRRFKAGSFFGEIAFVATAKKAFGNVGQVRPQEQLRVSDVVAEDECTCWELDVRYFVEVITNDLRNNRGVLKLLSTVSDERLEEARRLGVTGLPVAEGIAEDDEYEGTDNEFVPELQRFDSNMEEQMEDGVDFGHLYEIVPGRLCFTVHESEAQTRLDIMHKREIYFFSSELHEAYEAYCDDFGPVNLGTVYSFCRLLQQKMSDARLSKRIMCYYAERDIRLRTNAAFLLGAFLVIVMGLSPEDAVKPLEALGPCAFLPFRDATHTRPSNFHLTLLNCMQGLKRAIAQGWFDLSTFDVHKYCNMDNPAVYDMHQICPKFVAFRGPDCRDKYLRKPKDFIGVFERLGVKAVVRLNEVETYDKAEFENHGIQVYDLQFEDCTTPPASIVERFLRVVDEVEGIVAVHCLAGLGRTGTLIAIWMMTNMGWKARECIAWLRIVRPGSVLGTQQHYLEACERTIAKGLPLPEPDEVEIAKAARMAKQVQVGMLNRRDRRRSSSSVLTFSSSSGSVSGISESETALLESLAACAQDHAVARSRSKSHMV